jgi:hypothetical protein
LAMVFPDRKLGTDGIDIYCEYLSDIPAEVLEIAIKHHIQTGKFFPAISEIRDQAADPWKTWELNRRYTPNLNLKILPESPDAITERKESEIKGRRIMEEVRERMASRSKQIKIIKPRINEIRKPSPIKLDRREMELNEIKIKTSAAEVANA